MKVKQTIDGQRFVVLAVHGPTKPGSDLKLAQRAFLARCKVFLTMRRPGTVKAIVGDFNVNLDDLRKWAPKGADVAGHHIDACIVVGAKVKAERLGKFGSDHEAVRFTVTA